MGFATSPKLGLLAVSLLMAGCASFEPRLTYRELAYARPPTARQSEEGLEISVEEFASKAKSLQAFDSYLAAQSVFAALLRIQNNSGGTYRVARSQISASLDGEGLENLDARAAAAQGAAKDPSGRALAWTAATGPFAVLFAPLTLIGSSAHTTSVNRTIEEHFGSVELPNALIRQNQSVSGFVYFKVPPRVSRLTNLVITVEPRNDDTGEKLSYTFELPPLDVELPLSPHDRQRVEE